LWEIESGRRLRKLEGRIGKVLSITISPDGSHMVIVYGTKTLEVWKLNIKNKFFGEYQFCKVKGYKVFTQQKSGLKEKLNQVEDLFQSDKLKEALSALMALWKDNGYLEEDVFTSLYKKLHLAGKKRALQVSFKIRDLTEYANPVNSVTVTANGRFLVSIGASGALMLWDLETGRDLKTLKEGQCAIYSFAFIRDGGREISESSDDRFLLSDLERDRCLRISEGHKGDVISVAVTPDGRRLVTSGTDNILKSWDFETGRCLETFEDHEGEVIAVAVTPDGKHVVSASKDKTLNLWELETGIRVRTLKGHKGGINSIALTNAGLVLSGSNDTTLMLWDPFLPAWDSCRRILKGHTSSVNSVAVTPDGRHAVSGSADKTLKLWDLKTRRCLKTLEDHKGIVKTVAISPDGRYVFSVGDDNTLRMWRLIWDIEFPEPLSTEQKHNE
jgi:WD40 repeat protein